MAAAARAVGLVGVSTDERPVEVGVTQPEQLVRCRLGHPIFASWLDRLGPIMRPYRPVVVLSSAR